MNPTPHNLIVSAAIQVQAIGRAAGPIRRRAGIFYLYIEVMELKASLADSLNGYKAAGVRLRRTTEPT
jgi:hypothetical protein